MQMEDKNRRYSLIFGANLNQIFYKTGGSMKTKKLGKKLALSKATIANLEQNELSAVRGGYYYTEFWGGCNSWHPVCFTKPEQHCLTQISICHCTKTC
jgi:natural product precursor